ncbi:MAG: serine hydrolase domain-containing protein [Verrucomicrobiia bacterium]
MQGDGVETIFRENFRSHGEVGASFSVWSSEGAVVDLFGGRRGSSLESPLWTRDTLCLIWSCSKILASVVLLDCLGERGLALHEEVATIWPGFAENGKEKVTFAHVLGHQSGLCALDAPVPDMTEAEAVVTALQKQRPFWQPGEAHGYHAGTYGHLIDGCVRSLTGRSVQQEWRERFAAPLKLNIFFGVPPERSGDVAEVLAPRGFSQQEHDKTFYAKLADPQSLTARAFASPGGKRTASAMNRPEARAAGFPSFGAFATASSLAHWMAILANDGVWDGHRVVRWPEGMRERLAEGPDLIFGSPTAYGPGWMLDPRDERGCKQRSLFGPEGGAFGQPGAGGVHCFADPVSRLGFAYVMNAMGPGLFPNERCLRLIQEFYALA